MAMADRNGLPLAVGIACGQRHEAPLARPTVELGVDMIAPHKCNRRHKTQDGRKLRRYRRRWKVERLFAWLLRFRRLVTRYESKAENFLGFLHLGCLVIYLRRL